MKPLHLTSVIAVALLLFAGGLTWRFLSPPHPVPPPNQQQPIPPPAFDPATVFQKAFWRLPAPDDRILHAERREEKNATNTVEKWQWFITIQPNPAFREWLLKENPFDLVAVEPTAPFPALAAPPPWFPPAAQLVAFTRYRNREGRFLVFLDEKNNRLFATDSGGGFAVPPVK